MTELLAAPAADQPTGHQHGRRPGLRRMIGGIALDVGLPLGTYYLLHLLGLGDWQALLSATAVAGLRTVWGVVRQRSLNPFAAFLLLVFGLGLVLSLVSGDARFLLLKDSITTGVVGLAFLASTLLRRPLTLAVVQRLTPARADALAEAFHTNPAVRRAHLVCSTVWGAGLLLEALARIPLVYLLPIDVMVGVSTAMMVIAYAALVAWNGAYARRARVLRP